MKQSGDSKRDSDEEDAEGEGGRLRDVTVDMASKASINRLQQVSLGPS